VSPETWLLFITLAFFISATPGPVMMLAMSHGATYGIGHTLLGITGVSLGNLTLMLLSAGGVGALLKTSEKLLPILQWLGAAYLVYLGCRIWLMPRSAKPGIAGNTEKRKIFSRSFLVAASNPKGLIFFGALFPQFIAPDRPLTLQLVLLACTFLLIDGLWQLLYAAGGNTLSNWLKTSDNTGLINKSSACVLAGSGVLLAINNLHHGL
jgi:threonine/homoserine/homoserine lactone efflux protein